jgi:hypothetical protein
MNVETSDWLAKYERERDERAAGLPKRGEMLREQLKLNGITKVEAEYSGSGDSGQIDGVTFEPDTIKLPPELEHEVEQLFYDVLEARYAGWENNDGASGTFTWDINGKDSGFHHEHCEYYTESNDYSHDGFGKATRDKKVDGDKPLDNTEEAEPL